MRTLDAECAREPLLREPHWTETAAVGDRDWIKELADRLPSSWRSVGSLDPGAERTGVAEEAGTYVIRVSGRRWEGLLGAIAP